MVLGIVELYCGSSGKKGFYNSQEIGLARAMKALGYSSVIFYPNKKLKYFEEETVEKDIKIVYVPAKTLGVHSKYDWNVVKEYSVDAVQIGSDNQIFAPDLIDFCLNNHIPVYSLIGTVKSDAACGIKSIIQNILFKRNINRYCKTKCFAKTPMVKEALENYGVRNVELAPVGLDLSVIPFINESRNELRDIVGISRNKIVLLFVGRMDVYKRPFDVLELLEKLDSSHHLIMIGTGNLDSEIDKQIKEKKLSARVTQIKQIPNSEVHKFYVMSDYYLNFNTHEIFGMSILEAMYQGCNVIANHAPGPDYIIEDRKSGFLVNGIEEMKEIIEGCVSLDSSCIKERITKQFIWECSAMKFNRWIQSQMRKG